jgi:hypothetical protein
LRRQRCAPRPQQLALPRGLGVIGAVTLSRRSANSSARATLWPIGAGKNWAKGHYKGLSTDAYTPPPVVYRLLQ